MATVETTHRTVICGHCDQQLTGTRTAPGRYTVPAHATPVGMPCAGARTDLGHPVAPGSAR